MTFETRSDSHYDSNGHLVDSNGNAHVDVPEDDPLHKRNVHVDADLAQPADPTNVEDMKMAAPETPAERAGVKSSAPFLMDGALKYVQFAGADKKTVFIITNKHHLFRSVDSGFTFHAQADKLDSPSGIAQMYHSPADANVLFFLGTDLTHWMTRDLGETYQHVKVPEGSKLLEVELHPTMPGWLLAAALAPECNGHMQPTHAPTAEPTVDEMLNPTHAPGCNRMILLSQDHGASFTIILTYAVQFAWGPKGRNQQLVFATALSDKSGVQHFGKWSPGTNLIMSEDWFKTETVVVEHANRMLFSRYFMFVATVDPNDQAQVRIAVNRDNATTTRFDLLQLPVELTQHSYSLLDSSEGSVFLHINHMGAEAKMGMVYASDASGVAYSLSLPNNRRNANGVCDFEKVQGVEGIYIANFIEEQQQMIAPPHEGMSEQSATPPQEQLKVEQLTKSVITFDKGAEWVFLKAPEHDAHGKKYECVGACHLHLNGVTSSFGPFYSSATAIGLMLGTGNVGPHLREDIDAMNVYFSRDAGLTWFEIATGSHIYEMGNHGGIIVMANNHAATQNVVYSFDEGLSWNFHKISETPVHVDNIIVDPHATGMVFLVYGRAEDAGFVLQLDFSQLHERACGGVDAPNSAASDFEEWSPSDGRSKSCLLGHTITYVRRKRDHACYHAEDHAPTRSYEHCACTDANFECDFGFKREFTETGQTGACIPDETAKINGLGSSVAVAGGGLSVPPAQCDGFYLSTRGYRRIAGDTCVGGTEFLPVLTPCAIGYAHSGHVGTVLLVILSLMALSLCAVTLANRYEPLRNMLLGVREKFGDVSYGKIGSPALGSAGSAGAARGGSSSGHQAIGADGLLGGAPDSMMDEDDFGLDEEVGMQAPQLGSKGSGAAGSDLEFGSTGGAAASKASIPTRSFAPLPAASAPKEVKIPILQPHAGDDFDPRA